jgi:hypothetical protein
LRLEVLSDSQFGDLSITRNLAIALKHLLDTEEPRILWIDAICIYQEGFPKRSAQVYRMGSVYRRTRQVSIWLGPRSANSDIVMLAIKELSQDIRYVLEEQFVKATKGKHGCSRRG